MWKSLVMKHMLLGRLNSFHSTAKNNHGILLEGRSILPAGNKQQPTAKQQQNSSVMQER